MPDSCATPVSAKRPSHGIEKGALIERIAIVMLITNYEVPEGNIQISQKENDCSSSYSSTKRKQGYEILPKPLWTQKVNVGLHQQKYKII